MHSYTWRTGMREAGLIALAVTFSLPLYLIVSIAMRRQDELLESPLGLPLPPRLSNIGDAWASSGQTGATSLFSGLVNSAIITSVTLALVVLLGAMAAYYIARTDGPTGPILLGALVAGLVLPAQLSMIPLFSLLRELGVTGSRIGVILVYVGVLMPVPTLLFTGFIRRLPRELEEAALLDGASKLRVFFTVVFPLLRPVAITVAVLVGIAVWNDFFTPLILLGGSDNATLPVALFSFVGQNSTNYPYLFSGVLIAVLPVMIVYVVAQRWIAESLAGGLRG